MSFSLTAVPLPGSGDLQVFVGGIAKAVTLTQTGSTPVSETQILGSTWSSASPFAMSAQSGATDFNCIASCQDVNGTAHLWAIPNLGHTLETRNKPSASADWSQPAAFSPQPPTGDDGPLSAITAGKSVAGRIQLFAALPDKTAGNSTLVTTWETAENSGTYYDWQPMAGAPALALEACLTCHNLPDGRLQLWAAAADGALMTCWKSGAQKNAPWTPWETAATGSGTPITGLAGGVDADGYVEIWACGADGVTNGIQESWPSAQASWTNTVYAINPGPSKPYALAAAKLKSGDLQVFLVGQIPDTNDDYGLYAQGVVVNGGYGWQLLANLT